MTLRQVLFAATLSGGSSCIPRMRGLQALGLQVHPLDTGSLYASSSRLVNSITRRSFLTPRGIALNRALFDACRQLQPDVLWLDKAVWVYPPVLRRVRKHARFIVHYNTDDVLASGVEFWLYRLAMHQYDLHMTTNRRNVMELAVRYGANVMRAGMGYDRAIQDRAPSHPREVVYFGGHWEPHTEHYIAALAAAGVPLRLHGHNWRKARDRRLRSIQPAAYADYLDATASAQVALCILSRRNRNESTIRSFEIPALGVCMLAERTREHDFIYGEGCGVTLFSDATELVEKVKWLLADDDARRALAAEGRRRCLTLGLSWEEHMQREWRMIERLLLQDEALSPADDAPFWQGFRRGENWRPPVHRRCA